MSAAKKDHGSTGSGPSAGPVPKPRPAPPVDSLLHPLTFQLSGAQRARVLAALRRVHRQRSEALLRVLVELETRGDADARGGGRSGVHRNARYEDGAGDGHRGCGSD